MENVLISLASQIDKLVRAQIFSQPKAKAFALAAYAAAEDSGEGEIFDRAMQHVHEPRFVKMLERHRDDETRHARILRERRDQLRLMVLDVPEHLALVDRLSDAAGGVLDKTFRTDDEVAEAWAMLYVIEERALDEFKRSGEALAGAGDEETSALFFSIRKDEEKHLRYCLAVGHRYDPTGFDARIAKMRAIELVAYGTISRQWTKHQLDSGYLKLPLLLNVTVRSLTIISEWLRLPAPPPTVDDVSVTRDEKIAA